MQLNYRKLGKGGCPLIILHGLYGSGDNWYSIGKKLSERYTVYLVDQRNHGESPHSNDLNYQVLTDDLKHFLDSHDLNPACLMGHSMGGKVVMNFTLQYPGRVNRLVVIDIALRSYWKEFQDKQSIQSSIHRKIVDSLAALDIDFADSREEIDKQLARSLPQKAVRQFLLKNLKRNSDGEFYWGLNIDAVQENLPDLLAEIPTENQLFQGPALVISGKKSGYISTGDRTDFQRVFPSVHIEEMDAGHWLHAEQPDQLLQILVSFLTGD